MAYRKVKSTTKILKQKNGRFWVKEPRHTEIVPGEKFYLYGSTRQDLHRFSSIAQPRAHAIRLLTHPSR